MHGDFCPANFGQAGEKTGNVNNVASDSGSILLANLAATESPVYKALFHYDILCLFLYFIIIIIKFKAKLNRQADM